QKANLPRPRRHARLYLDRAHDRGRHHRHPRGDRHSALREHPVPGAHRQGTGGYADARHRRQHLLRARGHAAHHARRAELGGHEQPGPDRGSLHGRHAEPARRVGRLCLCLGRRGHVHHLLERRLHHRQPAVTTKGAEPVSTLRPRLASSSYFALTVTLWATILPSRLVYVTVTGSPSRRSFAVRAFPTASTRVAPSRANAHSLSFCP